MSKRYRVLPVEVRKRGILRLDRLESLDPVVVDELANPDRVARHDIEGGRTGTEFQNHLLVVRLIGHLLARDLHPATRMLAISLGDRAQHGVGPRDVGEQDIEVDGVARRGLERQPDGRRRGCGAQSLQDSTT